MLSEDRLYWIWLADRCGAASKEFARLIARFDNPFEIFRLEAEELYAIDCIGNRLKDRLSEKSLERSYSILKYCKKSGIEIITYADKNYPSRLKTLEDPPALLYCIGKLPDMDRKLCVGVVGTRKISAYGMRSSYKISYELASADVCVVSGMALGVDAVAACAAMEAGGVTVAVLGSGIDIVYPKEHTKLQRAISKHGAVISEYPPAEPPYGNNFPKRNRLISGLCQGVLVVEGNLRSGAMITAERAIAQGREVFALPGKINESNSEGTNDLIQRGVNVALCATDIVNHFDFLYGDVVDRTGLYLGKRKSEFSDKVLKRFGVSCEVFYGEDGLLTKKKGKGEGVSSSEENGVSPDAQSDKETRVGDSNAPRSAPVTTTEPDNSSALLESLDDMTRRVFDLMPIDRAISIDEFMTQGIGIADAMTSLTLLEINGLVSSLPGGTYIRK